MHRPLKSATVGKGGRAETSDHSAAGLTVTRFIKPHCASIGCSELGDPTCGHLAHSRDDTRVCTRTGVCVGRGADTGGGRCQRRGWVLLEVASRGCCAAAGCLPGLLLVNPQHRFHKQPFSVLGNSPCVPPPPPPVLENRLLYRFPHSTAILGKESLGRVLSPAWKRPFCSQAGVTELR